MEGDYMVQHLVYCWVVKNVYLCEKLLSSCIEGPPFSRCTTSKCRWTLQLGQRAESKEDGICLFIKPTDIFKDVVVNFNVSVREQMDAKPFMNEKFQGKFREGSVWSSPVIITNEEFRQKFVKSQKLSRFWDIRVQLVYNEIVDPVLVKGFPKMTSDLEYKREVGANLKKYLYGQFSDTYIKIAGEEIKAHRAILYARCDYFSAKLNSYEKSLVKEDDLMVTDDPEVMKSIIVYLYTGDIYSLDYPLPLGIHKCARRMKLHDLEWITQPSEAGGVTNVDSQTIDFDFYFPEFKSEFEESLSKGKIESSAFGDRKNNMFVLLIKVTKASPPHLSVFVKMASGEPSFALLELSIKSAAKKAIFTKKTLGHLKIDDCLGFEEFISMEELLNNKECVEEDQLRLICKITYSKGIVDTFEKSTSGKLIFASGENLSDEDVYCATYNGYRALSDDLKSLFKKTAFSDCTVVIGEKRFHAHKVILAARSSYFFEKLEGDKMQKMDSINAFIDEIVVDENILDKDEHMNIILEEIYTGSVEIKDKSIAEALYKPSRFFGLSTLEKKCRYHMVITSEENMPVDYNEL